MTSYQIKEFVDSVSHDDLFVSLYGKAYFCLGPQQYLPDQEFRVQVFETDEKTKEATRTLFKYHSSSIEDCMKHFLEDKYWGGKSFYEVASDMEWL